MCIDFSLQYVLLIKFALIDKVARLRRVCRKHKKLSVLELFQS